MNLNAIAASALGTISPAQQVVYQRSTGYVTNDDGSRTPSYATALTLSAQIQPLTYNEIQHLDGLNIQGRRRAVYLNGHWDGLERDRVKGGDLVTFGDGRVWLVVLVSESWPDWCRVVLTLQDGI